MTVYDDQLERARGRMREIFAEQRLGGVRFRAERGHRVEWAPPLNPSYFGVPDGSRKYVVEPATVPIDDWLALQRRASSGSPFMFRQGAYQPTVDRAAESIRTGANDIPTPVLEVKTDGSIPQEGRSRAMGAREGGATEMPVWIAVQVYR